MIPRILLIEDDSSIATAVQRAIPADRFRTEVSNRGDTGLDLAIKEDFDVVITDLKLPGLDGMELIRKLHAAKPLMPLILITAHGTTDVAIEATKLGAYDYLQKPFGIGDLMQLVEKASTSRRMMDEHVVLGKSPDGQNAIVGNCRSMQSLYKEIGRIAAKPVTVLIQGATGTGKELLARAIYKHSDRKDRPFIAINCAAIPETLLESELFGHERGAFTGANLQRIGRFEQANEGTLFLDEIGDISLGTQSKLLRVLQEKCIQRLGGKETIPVDVRVLAATHQDLEQLIRQDKFREDLYYRLKVVVLHLPPLRERREDITDLVGYFLQKHGTDLGFPKSTISNPALTMLIEHEWPGNIRELENAVKDAILLARGFPIGPDDVREVLSSREDPRAVVEEGGGWKSLITSHLTQAAQGTSGKVAYRIQEEVERELYSQAIQKAGGNQAKAAKWLGVSRPTMRDKLLQYGLIQ
jgi:nitrogen regulation protein NR(I)